jgi:hypothetical protein
MRFAVRPPTIQDTIDAGGEAGAAKAGCGGSGTTSTGTKPAIAVASICSRQV